MHETNAAPFCFLPAGELRPGEHPEYEFDPGCRYLAGDALAASRKRMALPGVFDPESVARKELNVRYGALDAQLLDLYYPDEGEGPFPVVFYIHGGGWILGSRRDSSLAPILRAAAARGFAVASVEYRLAPGTRFPENLFDVKTAVRWARANAEKYRLDPARFGVTGDSAGGYFTLMLAATAGVPALEGEQYGWAGVSSAVQAAVDFYGPVDMERDWSEYYAESGVPRLPLKLVGHPGMEEFEFCTMSAPWFAPLVCPHRYVTKDIPPVLILHGESDGVVPYQNSVLMYRRICEVCGEGRAKLLLYPERVHGDKEFMDGQSAALAADFFDRVFHGQRPFDD